MQTAYEAHGRELTLVGCACARRFSHLFRPEHFAVVERVERIVDGTEAVPDGELTAPVLLMELMSALAPGYPTGENMWFPLLPPVGADGRGEELAAHEAILRDVTGGDPAPLPEIDGRWLTADVVGLAGHMYGSGDFSAMPVLADALQDAGFEDAVVLGHCRTGAPHVRGCWVVDEVLRLRSEEVRRGKFDDHLTGVGNRRALDVMLEEAVRRAVNVSAPLSVLHLDLDHFGGINSTFSHAVADRTLFEVARLLRAALGGSGFLARTGGQAFTVGLRSTGPEAAVNLAERLRQAVAEWRGPARRWLGGWTGLTAAGAPAEVSVTVSIGVATLDPAAPDTARLLEDAEDALKRAKAGGRNRVCCELRA